ncbi:Spo0B domain-containing protein [Lysinibacillus louembei]|uniref:Spo0B domain-containing protein n=1 Tax=Lysinibacillus louembei TaxID=1470088 RepID=A0ABZ0S1T7_9BACI|nr:Spo0B domain-containing protein [Lysinibacillus louembei]WPK13148.1 Spo0B domain-containing protein [Lysinibacillus louembei]
MKNKKIKIIMAISIILLLFSTTANVATSYMKVKKTVEESIINQSLSIGTSIAASIDMKVYKRFLKNPEKNKDYWEIRNYLSDAKDKTGALYIYTIKIDNPTVARAMVVGHPVVAERKDDFPIGEICLIPQKFVREAYYHSQSFVTDFVEDSKYGTYLTVGVPIKDEGGHVIGYLGIDLSASFLDKIKKDVIENNILLFIFNGALIIITITSFFLIQRWYQKELAKEVDDTEDTYQTEIKALITSVSSLRHDFTNHIQVLHGLLQLGEPEQAKQYVEALSKEVQTLESLNLNIDHPGLAILLQTKKLAAQNNQIDMDFTVSQNTFEYIKTTDLIKILSNLIDNAIDATIHLPEEQRKIVVTCTAEFKKYIFQITNTGPALSPDAPVFEQGYSTKCEEKGEVHGQGLFIVKNIVEKYGGQISLYSINELETVAYVEIPLKL